MRILNFAIVGSGRISQRHADSIINLERARLVAVCDIIKNRADFFAKKYNIRSYYSFARLLKDKDIDVVNICTPSFLHASMGIQAAQANKHIIMEKPIATNLNDGLKLIEVCKKNKLKLCVVYQNRYNPSIKELKKIVEKGGLGKLNLASVCVRWYRPPEYYKDWHGDPIMSGGGALMTQAIHHLDILQWLMGMPEEVIAYAGNLSHKIKVEDTVISLIKFRNGALATIEASTITYPKNIEASVALFGEKGSVKVGGLALNQKVFWFVKNHDLSKKILAEKDFEPVNIYGVNHKAAINDMVEAILKDREPEINGVEGLKSLKIVLAIYQAAKTRKTVKL